MSIEVLQIGVPFGRLKLRFHSDGPYHEAKPTDIPQTLRRHASEWVKFIIPSPVQKGKQPCRSIIESSNQSSSTLIKSISNHHHHHQHHHHDHHGNGSKDYPNKYPAKNNQLAQQRLMKLSDCELSYGYGEATGGANTELGACRLPGSLSVDCHWLYWLPTYDQNQDPKVITNNISSGTLKMKESSTTFTQNA